LSSLDNKTVASSDRSCISSASFGILGGDQNWDKSYTSFIYTFFIPDLSQPGTNIGINYSLYKKLHLPWNQYHDGPAKKLSMAAMAAIVLVAIAVGNNGGNSGGGGSSGGGGGCNNEDIGSYSIGGAHRQQSTKSGRGRNGEDNDDNGQGRQRQRARTTTMARTTTVRTTATTARMTGKDNEDNRQWPRRHQGRQH
jgi:hypothetical protein